MDNEEKILSLMGLATRGRNLTSGEDQVLDAIRSGKAYLVVVASDASDNTKKLFNDKCTYYDVPVKIWGVRDKLGHAIGKEQRASLAITEAGFAKKLVTLMEE
ncbi:MAG: ribosomal L7Ae/L30e/S12e/Gadd45 family protein [Lachnospiraceae bacterium]|nr:ribosomal L7Ae/L30e/S12e/Gadd45 family protein [Lachnospiraceae bacterium]